MAQSGEGWKNAGNFNPGKATGQLTDTDIKLLDSFSVKHGNDTRRVELFHGDLLNIPCEEAVDLLVVSAFPDDYVPTERSLIGGLARKGLSVQELAQHKAVDLRQAFSCWLSQDIGPLAGRFGFKRILCFEPLFRGAPAEVVGEIFQSLMPFAHGEPPIKTVAMPLVASGDQQVGTEVIFQPLLEAATRWLSIGLPIDRLKIVERSEAKAKELARLFEEFKNSSPSLPSVTRKKHSYHAFISYSHKNNETVDYLVEELKRRKPDIRVFLDRHEIDIGKSWQSEIFESLDDCDKVVAVFSPSYLDSKVCKEEFNIAKLRHTEEDCGVLLPIFLYSANLPDYMLRYQYFDCRENDRSKLADACKKIIRKIEEERK